MTVIASLNFDSVTAPALPAGWNASSINIVTTTLQALSAPNSLTQVVGTDQVELFTKATADGNGGNVQIDVAFAINSDSADGYVVARCDATPAPNTLVFAHLDVTSGATTYGFYLGDYVSGTKTERAFSGNGTLTNFVANTWYLMRFIVSGSSLSLQVIRDSDGFYLQSDFTFAAGQHVLITATTPVAAASGYYGVGFFKASATTATKVVYLDNLVVSTAAPPRSATNYYLSTTGNDSNDGLTPGTAWLTLAKATTGPDGGYIDGDTLNVAAGQAFTAGAGTGCLTFTKRVSVVGASSTKSSWPTLNAGDYWGIRYHDTVPGTVQYVKLVGSGFNATTGVGTNGGAGSQPTYPAVDGVGIDLWSDTHVGAYYTQANGNTISNIEISGFFWGVVLRAESGTHDPDGFANVSITNYLIHDCLQSGIVTYGGNSSNRSGTPFNFYVTNRPHAGLYLADGESYNIFGDPNATVWSGVVHQINNVSYGIGERIYAHDSGSLLAKNTILTYSSGGGGGLICLGCTGWTWQDCEVARMTTLLSYDACGFDIDGDCDGCLMQRCYSHNCYGPGFQTGIYPQTSGPTVTTTDDTIRYSVSANDGLNPRTNGIPQVALADFGSGTDPTNGTLFYGMTVYLGAGDPSAAFKPAGFSRTNAGSSTFARIYNSIFYVSTAGSAHVYMGSSATGPDLKGNDYYYAPGTGSALWRLGGVSYTTLAGIQGAGYETFNGTNTGSTANPQFRNPGFHGTLGYEKLPRKFLTAYDIKSGSSAYTSGVNLFSLLPMEAVQSVPDLRLTLRPGSSPAAAGASAPSQNSGDILSLGGGNSNMGFSAVVEDYRPLPDAVAGTILLEDQDQRSMIGFLVTLDGDIVGKMLGSAGANRTVSVVAGQTIDGRWRSLDSSGTTAGLLIAIGAARRI